MATVQDNPPRSWGKSPTRPQPDTAPAPGPTRDDRGSGFTPRRHHIASLAKDDPLVAQLLDDLDGYSAANATASRALELIKQIQATAAPQVPVPTTADQITDEWLNGEVARRLGNRERDAKLDALNVIRFDNAQLATDLIDANLEVLIKGLAKHFDALLEEITTAVHNLNGAADASSAIETGVAEHWAALIKLRPRYDKIRASQLLFYRDSTIDRLACGEGQSLIRDPEARLYFHRRLDDVAPRWRGGVERVGPSDKLQFDSELPWPNDPIERLVWCVRVDSGMWLPTPAEVKQLLSSRTVEPPAMPGNPVARDETDKHRAAGTYAKPSRAWDSRAS